MQEVLVSKLAVSHAHYSTNMATFLDSEYLSEQLIR
jgi:hypothetical protein